MTDQELIAFKASIKELHDSLADHVKMHDTIDRSNRYWGITPCGIYAGRWAQLSLPRIVSFLDDTQGYSICAYPLNRQGVVLNNDSTDSRRYWSLSDYYNITLEEPTLAMIAASVKVNNHYQRLVSKKYRHNIELLNVDLMKEAEQAVYGWTHDFESLLPKD